ncbi:Na/H antiporter [Pochonia chlamydosporia 170]|uniref:Na/H antiporter n=1 Tax=Pochonia chlamydosporia 170 TaxID=1380566 RepID=A0A179F648_METCM|nr:Na/H antiporter [Pochonia chlamydosporia 170]OAQ60914.1 Na/H antiporter [Pochonia chlamydosporia 170]
MTCMWMATSLLVWGLVETPSFLHALAVGACVTPTDPVLSAVIVKGKFADHNIPKDLQDLIVAESGANDGLGYPFLFFALYLIKLMVRVYVGIHHYPEHHLRRGRGLIAKELLHFAEDRNYVDRESFLVFAIALALFVLGTCGMIGTDDVLACFIAGNTFTWDDWFRLQTKDDSLQPTVDMLLNVSIFLWYGAYLPWETFANNPIVPLSRLVPLGLLVLILRRLPWVFGMHAWIPQIRQIRQAIFVGFFGPIGVSAIFYLFISIEFIEEHMSDENGVPREDVKDLAETIRIVVWFLAVCSIVVHGLSIPLGRLGYLAPRIHRVLSENFSETFSNQNSIENGRKVPMIGRLFSPAPQDPEANLAARVRQGSAPITRTGRGALPSRITERYQASRGNNTWGSDGDEASESADARAGAEDKAGGLWTWTPARSARREILFLDEVTRGTDPRDRGPPPNSPPKGVD